MRWDKVDARWEKRKNTPPGGELESGVTYAIEKWEIPGEEPLEIRVCTRSGHPMKDFCNTRETPKTSIVLHTTAGYGTFSTLMGGDGDGRKASAHFMLGRDGISYLLVKTEYVAWHATWWNENSVGIEVDTICELRKSGGKFHSEYGPNDVYCAEGDTGAWMEKPWVGHGNAKYWATWTEAQYVGCGRLIKALCHKHQIPRLILPEPARYAPFKPDDRKRFKGVCTHLQIDPARRIDIGPFIDWDKLLTYGAVEQGDCYSAPPYTAPTGPTTPGSPATPSTTTQTVEVLKPPVQVNASTVRVSVGHRGGRIALTVRKPGEPVPTTPAPGDLPSPIADGKRDEFIHSAMNFLGCPYKAGSRTPKDGIDGVGLVAMCLKRVGLVKEEDPAMDGPAIFAIWPFHGGTRESVPQEILPGDLAWFGQGDHDTDAQQHPMIYLGGERVLGPVPNGGPQDGAVQVIHLKDVPEHFAGWTHIDDLGTATDHGAHPGTPPAPGTKLGGALLPMAPAGRYDALKAIVEKQGGKWEADKNKVNLVGVKNLHDRCLISPAPDAYNDSLFAAFLDDEGHKCCLDLRASLNPGTDNAKAGTWQLQEGPWKFKLADAEGVAGVKALQPADKVKGWFDKDGLGAPRGGDLAQPSSITIDPLPSHPELNPQHPDHPDNPKNPNRPPPLPDVPGAPISRKAGPWEDFIDKEDAVPDEIIQQITDARAKYPPRKFKEMTFGSYKGPNIRVFVLDDGNHRAFTQDYLAKKLASASTKAEKFAFGCYKVLLQREGGTADFNCYDNMIVTWGTGFGANNGALMPLLTKLQKNEAARNELRNLGFMFDKQRFHVVDTRDKKVKSTKGKSHLEALEAWRTQDDLLAAFVGMAVSPDTRAAVLDANLAQYKEHSASFAGIDNLNSQAAFSFISHLHHWLPAFAAGCVTNAVNGGAQGDVAIALASCKQFVQKIKDNGWDKKISWNQLKGYWDQMRSDGLSEADKACDTDFGI